MARLFSSFQVANMGKNGVCMVRRLVFIICLVVPIMGIHLCNLCWAEQKSLFEMVKAAELSHESSKGEVYLGKILTINYSINSAQVGRRYFKYLVELADVLKTPERLSYHIILKGFTDSTGPSWLNKDLSMRRAKVLKEILVNKYGLAPRRISVESFGAERPIASNETPEGRALNRRTEVHLCGDVSEAVKLLSHYFPGRPKKKAPSLTTRAEKEKAVPLVGRKKPKKIGKPVSRGVEKALPPIFTKKRGTPPVTEPLPKSLRGCKIEDYFLPSEEKGVGTIQALKGHVVVVHRKNKKAYFAKAGDIIYEKDTIITLSDGRCRIGIRGEDIIRMGSGTNIAVEFLIEEKHKNTKKSFFSLVKGKAIFYALRLFKYRYMTFRVQTPTAVVGVRGTKFGVYVYHSLHRNKEASMESKRWYTDAFCEHGQIYVDGITVPQGYAYSEKSGKVFPYSNHYLLQFEKDTSITDEWTRLGGRGTEKTREEVCPWCELRVGPGTFAMQVEETAQEINEQSVFGNLRFGMETGESELSGVGSQAYVKPKPEPGSGSEPQPEPEPGPEPSPPPEPGVSVPPEPKADLAGVSYNGYFTALLSRIKNGKEVLQDSYVSSSPQGFDGKTINASSIVNTGGYISLTPSFSDEGPSYVSRFVSNSEPGACSAELTQSSPCSKVVEGRNLYMEWGRWTMEDAWVSNTQTGYQVKNESWYIFGTPTDLPTITGLTGEVRYTGDAYGTFWSQGSGVLMRGIFDCTVNFDSGRIPRFNLFVSDPTQTYSASMRNASGELREGHFDLTGASSSLSDRFGTYSGSEAKVEGSFFGPGAERTGGAWGVYNETQKKSASGVFQGYRYVPRYKYDEYP